MEVRKMSDAENPTQALEVQDVEVVQEAEEPPKTPAPVATGNERIDIRKHSLSRLGVDGRGRALPTGVELAIRNVSASTIATAIFEAVFYDEEGSIVDKVRHGEIALEPETSRAIRITCSPHKFDRVKSYGVRIVRTTTADVERVQFMRHEIRTTETGEEEIRGIAKNISEAKTDAAIVATFYDLEQENLGTKVVLLRDIEPKTVRRFDLRFRPQEEDVVRSYTLRVGEIAE
jgi:hypothetical protein